PKRSHYVLPKRATMRITDPGATDVRPGTRVLSPGSVHLFCSVIDCDTRPLVCAPFVIVSRRRGEDKWGLEFMRGVVRARVHSDVTDMAVHEGKHARSIVVRMFPWRQRLMPRITVRGSEFLRKSVVDSMR